MDLGKIIRDGSANDKNKPSFNFQLLDPFKKSSVNSGLEVRLLSSLV